MNRFVSPAMFARHAGESRYPQLWRGLVGAWCPALGPTGATLRDWSGFCRHGTITGTLNSMWALSSGWAIDFAGASNEVSCGDVCDTPIGSACAWVRRNGNDGGYLVSKGPATAVTGYGFRFSPTVPNTIMGFVGDGSFKNTTTTETVSNMTWTLVGISFDGATLRVYIGGIERKSLAAGLSVANANLLKFGEFSSAASESAAMMDDIRIYDRKLSDSEWLLLASARGVAYQMRERRCVRIVSGNRRRRFMVSAA